MVEGLRGDLSLNAFVILLVERAATAINSPVRSSMKDREALAQILGLLGRNELFDNARTLADAARSGSLPMTPETAADIRNLAADLSEILRLLLKALDVRSGS